MLKQTIIDPNWAWDENFPLAQGLRVGDFLFMSGQVALDADGRVVGPGNLQTQARQVFENMKTILTKAGATFNNVVKLTTYFTSDVRNYEEYFTVRRQYFGDHRPASTGVQVVALAFQDLLLEVEAIAYVPRTRRRAARR